MIKIYEQNGLPFFNREWLETRSYIQQRVATVVEKHLRRANPAWSIYQIEAPTMIPNDLVSKEYSDEDVFRTQDFTMKPETTNSSYEYMKHLLDHQESKPPICVWQASKSYRRENDQVSANVRLKEFYQQEFQCVYTEGTQFNYQDLLEDIAEEIGKLVGLEHRVIESDRLPSYSKRTLDIEVKTPHKWLEVCSCSVRTDVPFEWNGKRLENTEFAFGLDRLTYVKDNKGDK